MFATKGILCREKKRWGGVHEGAEQRLFATSKVASQLGGCHFRWLLRECHSEEGVRQRKNGAVPIDEEDEDGWEDERGRSGCLGAVGGACTISGSGVEGERDEDEEEGGWWRGKIPRGAEEEDVDYPRLRGSSGEGSEYKGVVREEIR